MTRPKNRPHDRGTTIGVALFSWHLWQRMSLAARALWLTLYASPEARRCPLGLWHGGPAVMAEAGRLDAGVAVVALLELQELGAVEYDADTRVARLCELPDRCERPDNGRTLRSWWTRWSTIPACAVRDRHVATLRWLIGEYTADHQAAWDETFGLVERAAAGGRGGGSGDGTGYGIRYGQSSHSDDRQSNDLDGTGYRTGYGQGQGQGSISSFSGEKIADPGSISGRGGGGGVRPPLAVVPDEPGDPLGQLDPERAGDLLRDTGMADMLRRSFAHLGTRAAALAEAERGRERAERGRRR